MTTSDKAQARANDALNEAQARANNALDKAQTRANDALATAKDKAAEAEAHINDSLDGVVNPQGLLMGAFTLAFAAAVPITSYIAAPSGPLESVIHAFYRVLLPNSAAIPADRVIPALATIYTFWTFAATGALSAAGVNSAYKTGMDMNSPRTQINALRGLPLRLRSAHYNTMEMFPGFALAAALAQVLAPTNARVVNLLGLHVLVKMGLYYPSYVANIAPTRTLAHVLATGAVVNVGYQLALGATS